jgi:hypothetical protein
MCVSFLQFDSSSFANVATSFVSLQAGETIEIIQPFYVWWTRERVKRQESFAVYEKNLVVLQNQN